MGYTESWISRNIVQDLLCLLIESLFAPKDGGDGVVDLAFYSSIVRLERYIILQYVAAEVKLGWNASESCVPEPREITQHIACVAPVYKSDLAIILWEWSLPVFVEKVKGSKVLERWHFCSIAKFKTVVEGMTPTQIIALLRMGPVDIQKSGWVSLTLSVVSQIYFGSLEGCRKAKNGDWVPGCRWYQNLQIAVFRAPDGNVLVGMGWRRLSSPAARINVAVSHAQTPDLTNSRRVWCSGSLVWNLLRYVGKLISWTVRVIGKQRFHGLHWNLGVFVHFDRKFPMHCFVTTMESWYKLALHLHHLRLRIS